MTITGYHGTQTLSVSNIIATGYNYSGINNWFGSGIYFFETYELLCDGFIEARNWALHVKGFSDWAVFKAIINSEKYIDIAFNNDHKMTYDRIRKEAIDCHKRSGKNVDEFNENVIFRKMEKLDIDFIRALVDADKDMGYYSYTIRRPQLQICVKNKGIIFENSLFRQKVEHGDGTRKK